MGDMGVCACVALRCVCARARVCMLSRVLIVLQPYIGFTMHSDEAFDDEVARWARSGVIKRRDGVSIKTRAYPLNVVFRMRLGCVYCIQRHVGKRTRIGRQDNGRNGAPIVLALQSCKSGRRTARELR